MSITLAGVMSAFNFAAGAAFGAVAGIFSHMSLAGDFATAAAVGLSAGLVDYIGNKIAGSNALRTGSGLEGGLVQIGAALATQLLLVPAAAATTFHYAQRFLGS